MAKARAQFRVLRQHIVEWPLGRLDL